jgi:hypothetical protein
MEPVTLFLKPTFHIAVQPNGSLAVQVEANTKPAACAPPPPLRPAPVRWACRH